jgi:lipopolysaccharide/colanic/teichoic acid biosynthesis glycosyltransferase
MREKPVPPVTEIERPLELTGWYLVVKRWSDVIVSLALLVPAIVIIVLCSLLIKLTSRGPVFYTQMRLGRMGRPFRIWKLRTMTHNCELISGARWAMPNDPRTTTIGRFLRMTNLDELPQLWNILKGDMSLVGPRPERPEFMSVLEQAIPNYCQRLRVRPGVTGIAQLSLPHDTGVASVRRKLAYDLYYIHRSNFFLDLRLLVGIALKSIGLPWRFVRGLLLLPRPEAIEPTAISDGTRE